MVNMVILLILVGEQITLRKERRLMMRKIEGKTERNCLVGHTMPDVHVVHVGNGESGSGGEETVYSTYVSPWNKELESSSRTKSQGKGV